MAEPTGTRNWAMVCCQRRAIGIRRQARKAFPSPTTQGKQPRWPQVALAESRSGKQDPFLPRLVSVGSSMVAKAGPGSADELGFVPHITAMGDSQHPRW